MLEYTIFENSIYDWLIAIGLTLLIYFAFLLVKKIFQWRIAKWAAKTVTQFDDFLVKLIANTKNILLLIFALFFASNTVVLNDDIVNSIGVFTMIVLLMQIGFWLNAVISYLVHRQVSKQLKENAAEATTLSALGTVAKAVVWAVLVIMTLDNIPGVEVSTLITGLGIGGIAIGLAVQNILGDLLASLSIVMDRPFVIGDFILVGDLKGTVEHIGIKSTRLRSLTGEQLIFSNSDLLSSRIRNFQRMDRRRIVFEFGVTYQTAYEILAEIPGMLKNIIDPKEGVSFDRAHFQGYGDSALMFEVVYWIESSDYANYMDKQQEINLAVFQIFEDNKIEFAYPTQTIFVEKD
ncbi:MAG: mechanosensitive ion channel [Anaerolineaceae bacterium]|nr:mechanosensitive ion channel [Anaerolineaceae bacterium]